MNFILNFLLINNKLNQNNLILIKIINKFKFKMINNNEKQITIKVFISQNIESHNIQINKHEKIKNIKNIISNALNLDSTKIYLTYNNFNLEENESIQDELIMNISGNNKMPYFKVNFINEKKNLSESNLFKLIKFSASFNR